MQWTPAPQSQEGRLLALQQERERLERYRQLGIRGYDSPGFTDQFTAPINDEVAWASGYGMQGAENIARNLTGRPVEVSALDRARAMRQISNEGQDRFARERPVQAFTGGLLSAVAVAPARGAAIPGLIGRLGTEAGLGAAYGAAEGDSLSDRLSGAGFGAGIGLALGGAGEIAAPYIGRLVNRFRGRGGSASVSAPRGLIASADAAPAPRATPATESEAALARYRAAYPEATNARVLNPGDEGYPTNAQWDEASQTYVEPIASAYPAPAVMSRDMANDILAEAARGGSKLSYSDFRAANDGRLGTMFDYSRLNEVPDVPQVPLDRYVPARGTSPRMTDALNNPVVEQGLNATVARGLESGVPWYNIEPLRQRAESLGVGPEQFSRFTDIIAATSPRAKVPDNIRTASYYNYMQETGQPIAGNAPPGYGSIAGNLHRDNVLELQRNGGWNVFKNPKPASFSENFQGNQYVATIDTHNQRMPGILSRDPRFLETSIAELVRPGTSRDQVAANLMASYPNMRPEHLDDFLRNVDSDKPRVTFRPQQWVNEGSISMDEAVRDPGLWSSKPNDNEYGAYEAWQRAQAERMGLSTAQYQASMWTGGAAETGMASPPEPFLRTIESRVQYTAERMGLDPELVLDRFLKGSIPLLSVGGATVLVMGPDGQPQEASSDGSELPLTSN